MLDPIYTLPVVETVLNIEFREEESPWSLGSKRLIRLVLRVYNEPTVDEPLRCRCMEVFDRLIWRYPGAAHSVPADWDTR